MTENKPGKFPPRIVGIWRDGTFYVDDISRVCPGEEVQLISLREAQAMVRAARAAAYEEMHKNVCQFGSTKIEDILEHAIKAQAGEK